MADLQGHETGEENPRDLHIGRILNELLDRRARGEVIDEADLPAEPRTERKDRVTYRESLLATCGLVAVILVLTRMH